MITILFNFCTFPGQFRIRTPAVLPLQTAVVLLFLNFGLGSARQKHNRTSATEMGLTVPGILSVLYRLEPVIITLPNLSV